MSERRQLIKTHSHGKPWYLLMTIYGEPKNSFDTDLIRSNRRVWNGWACAQMSDSEREKIASSIGLSPEDLAPLSKEENALVKEQFASLLEHDNIPDPRAEIDFREVRFNPHFAAGQLVFPAKVDFSSSRFSEMANFENVFFAKDIIFSSARFAGQSKFDSALFKAKVFYENTYFRQRAVFSNGNFAQPVYFNGAEFAGGVDFEDAIFTHDAVFTSTTFEQSANFKNVQFRAGAWFNLGSFKRELTFEKARFSKMVPEFSGREFYDISTFTTEKSYWPKVTPDKAAQFKSYYSVLARAMSNLQKPDDEQFFRRQELRCRAHFGNWFDQVFLRFYGAISDFGYSIGRPAILLMLNILAGACVYALETEPKSETFWDCVLYVVENLGPSFSSVFAFLGFLRRFHEDFFSEKPWWIETVSGTQTILGVFTLFFLGLALRNRFRLK